MADADQAFAYAAVEGRTDLATFEVALGLLELCLGGSDTGFCLVQLRQAQYKVVGLILVAEILPVQARLLRASLLLRVCGGGLGKLRVGSGYRSFEIGFLKLDQNGALLEERAIVELRMRPER